MRNPISSLRVTITVLLLVLYVLSYLIWVPIAVERSSQEGLVNFFFVSPRSNGARDVHVVCCYLYAPFIFLERKLETGRHPGYIFPDDFSGKN
jgi:hypothetical protein